MSFLELTAQAVYNETFLTYLGSSIVILALILLVIIFIELRMKKSIKIKLNEKGIAYLKGIDKIRKSRGKPAQQMREINTLIKDFLKGYLKLSYTPTYGEALDLMEGKNLEDLKQVCNDASAVMYAGEKPTEEKLGKIIEMFENIVKYRLIKLDEEKAREIEKILGNAKEEFINERKIRMVVTSIKEGRKNITGNNLQAAYKSYNVITAVFKNMNQKEKEICKDKILNYYNEILEKSKKQKGKESTDLSDLTSFGIKKTRATAPFKVRFVSGSRF